MSIPWRGLCSNQYVVQIVNVFATFVSPVVLVYLTKKIYYVAQSIRGRTKLGLNSSERSDDKAELCDAFTEQQVCGQDINSNEEEISRGVFEERRAHQNVLQDLSLYPTEANQSELYCACGSSADCLGGSAKPLHEGEGGDCGRLVQMEPPYSERCPTKEAHPNTQQTDCPSNSLEVPKSEKSQEGHDCSPGEEASNRRGQASSPEDRNPTEQVCCQKDQTNDPQISTNAQTLPKSEDIPPPDTEEASCPLESTAKSPGDPTSNLKGPGSEKCRTDPTSCPADETPAKTLPVSGFDGTPSVHTNTSRDYANNPRNQARSLRNRTNIEKALEISEGSKSENKERQGQTEVEASVPEQSAEKGKGSTECQHIPEDVKLDKQIPSGSGTDAISSTPTPDKKEKLEDHRGMDSAVDNVLHEGSVEPHRVCSPSSSDSFSTANCSLASSATYIRSEASRPRQQAAPEQESGQHSTGVRKTDRQARRPERSHRDRKARHKHGCGHRKNSTSPPIFQLVTPPRLFQLSQGRHLKKSREASDDDDDISGLHGGSQAEEDETVDLSEWLSSTFKSWLPDFGSKREEKQKTSEQRPERRENSSHFERFDVRNILGTDHQIGQERFASEPKACPHSCVSSLCNFRRTLESWKKQLLAMHAALDASSAAISQRHCVYCDEDYHSRGPHQDCYTMHIAQEFWRTVLQFKRSHLESSECPYTGQHNSGRGSENDSGERDEQCSLGHRHSCSSDYSGCSQHQNSPVSEDVHEAPCVHVLLDDVDLLLKKLENLKQSSSPRKSKLSQTDSLSNTKMSEKVESYKGQPSLSCCHKNYLSDSPVSCGQSDARIPNKVTQHGDPPTLDERGRSTASMISPSPSISLAEELADLAELTGDEHCTDDEGSEKFLEHELARTEPVSSAAKASSTNETPVLNQDALLSGANSPQVSSHAKLCELSNRLKSLAKKLGDHVEADDCTVSENDHSTDVQSSETSQTDDHASTECPKNVSGASSATKTSLVKQGVLMPQARSLFVQPDSRLLELQSCPISLAEIPKDLEEPTVPIFSRKKICVHDQSSSSEKPTKLDNVPIECPYSAADDNSARKSRVIEDVPIMRAMSHDDELCANDQSSQKPKELENALTECPRSDSEMISGTILPLKNEEFPEPSAGLSQASSDFIYFHLPNLPTSLADSWADLKESCESILNRKEHCANNENSESPSPRQLESGPQKIPQSTSSLTHSSPHNEETMIPRAKSPQVLSDTRLLQLLTLSELPALAGEQRCVSRSEELAISRTRSLGKFALRYLDHIEQKLEANDLLTLGLEMASPKPTQGGDPPKPMPRAILKGGPTTSQTQFSGETPTPRKRQTDTVASHSGSLKEQQFSTVKEELKPWQNLPLRHVQALFSDDSNVDRAQFGHAWRSDTDQQDSRAPRGNPLGNSHTAQKEPSVIAAFQDIISELNKLQSGQPVARSRPPENAVDQGDKSARSVKFDTSSLRRSHSYANACPRHMNSPPLQPAVLSSSSCLSLTTSGEDVCERDLTVTQAFDQLDKVVDDLLKLISIQNFS